MTLMLLSAGYAQEAAAAVSAFAPTVPKKAGCPFAITFGCTPESPSPLNLLLVEKCALQEAALSVWAVDVRWIVAVTIVQSVATFKG
jgi:hypothetical protein